MPVTILVFSQAKYRFRCLRFRFLGGVLDEINDMLHHTTLQQAEPCGAAKGGFLMSWCQGTDLARLSSLASGVFCLRISQKSDVVGNIWKTTSVSVLSRKKGEIGHDSFSKLTRTAGKDFILSIIMTDLVQ